MLHTRLCAPARVGLPQGPRRGTRFLSIGLLSFLAAAPFGCANVDPRAPDVAVHGARQSGPSWCITGEVVYEDRGVVCVRPDGGLDVDPRLAGVRIVYPGPGVNERVLPRGHDPDWSPDGAWFACEIDGQIYRVERAGGGIHRLTDGGRNFQPRVSPDGRFIVYRFERDQPGLVSVGLRRTAVDGLERNDVGEPDGPIRRDADWFPDGRIVCAQARPEDGVTLNLFVVAPGGEELARLTRSSRAQHHPRVSPDGTRIAYIEQPARGAGELWVMDADGGAPRRVGTEPAAELDWSPDGREIVYVDLDDSGSAAARAAGANGTLRILTLATGRVRPLTTNWPESCPPAGAPLTPPD